MIAPAFLIKILGCATVGAFLTIGIPVIVANENERKAEEARHLSEATKVEAVQQRQAEIDNPSTISQFFSNLASTLTGATKPASEIKEGETFSNAAITAWSPTNETEKTSIATNFSSIIKHMPNEFFNKLKDKSLTEGKGVCHIQTSGTTVSQQTNQSLYIPFLKSALKSTFKDTQHNNDLFSVMAKGGQIDTHLGEFLKTDKANFKTKLQAIINGTKPYSQANASAANSQEQLIATDLLMLQTLYEETIDRLTKELGNPVTSPAGSAMIWVPVSCS